MSEPSEQAPVPGSDPVPVPVPNPAPVAEDDGRSDEPDEPPAKKTPRVPTLLEKLEGPLTVFVLALGITLLVLLQFSTRELIDHDSLYHVQAANQLARRGDRIILKRMYPWMQATFLRDHYADKEFGFHVVLVLERIVLEEMGVEGDMDLHGKIATVLLGALVLGAFTLALRGAGIRPAWLWLLLFLGAGENFTYRLLETRPHLLSIALVLVGVRFVLSRRSLPLYFVGFVLAWSYSGAEVLPLLALAAAVARFAREETIEVSPTLASTVGVVAGMVLNPFVPNNLYLWRVQNVDVLLRAWGFARPLTRMGAELSPYTTRELLLGSPGMCFAVALALAALLLARRRPSVRTVQLGALSLASLGALFLSAKLLDYAAPLAVLFAASAVDDQWQKGESSPRRTAAASVLLATALGLVALATLGARHIVVKYFSKEPQLRGAAKWLRANAQGVTVVHFDWNDFATLFHDDPDSFYLCGLDPTFIEVWRPDLLSYLEAVRRDEKPLSARWLADYDLEPKAKYLVVKTNTPEAGACLSANLRIEHEDEGGIVFALTD